MSYKGKAPFPYDRNGKSWKEGAHKHFQYISRERAEKIDRSLLGERRTKYHRFTSQGGGQSND